jgi:uncharacterized membrane protein
VTFIFFRVHLPAAIMESLFFLLRTMRGNLLRVALCGILCVTSVMAEEHHGVGAENTDERSRLKESWKKLSPEEREDLRRQMRAAWQSLSREEQERLRQTCREKDDEKDGKGGWFGRFGGDRAEDEKERKMRRCLHRGFKARWHDLSPEEREAFRSRLREGLRRKEGASGGEIPPESPPVHPQSGSLAR